ncbi:hypothetical protein V1511DRAFT_461756 [Dipodascopsis uninucleata]
MSQEERGLTSDDNRGRSSVQESAASGNLSKSSAFGSVFKTLTKGLRTSYTSSNLALPESSSVDRNHNSNPNDTESISKELVLDTLVNNLSSRSPLALRVEAAKELTDLITKRFIFFGIIEIWYAAQDMLSPACPLEARIACLSLLNACILYDSYEDSASVNKLVYYRSLVEYPVGDDFDLQLKAFQSLTKNGRELPVLGPSESPFVLILSTWLKKVANASSTTSPISPSSTATTSSTKPLQAMEQNLHMLCAYIVNVIKFNYYSFEENDIITLLEDCLQICRKTPSKEDITESIAMINTLTIYGNIPIMMLEPCVETLCSAYAAIPELEKATWETVLHLVNSHLGNNTIVTLYQILRAPSKSTNNNTIRGAVVFLQKLLEVEPESIKSYHLTVHAVMHSYKDILTAKDELHIAYVVCKSVVKFLLADETFNIVTAEDYESEDSPLTVLALCSKFAFISSSGSSKAFASTYADNIYQMLQQIVGRLTDTFNNGTFTGPISELISFFLCVNQFLDEPTMHIVLQYYEEEYLCYPSSSDWLENSEKLIDAFFRNQFRPQNIRINVFKHMQNVYYIAKQVSDAASTLTFLKSLFKCLSTEKDATILQLMLEFAVEIASYISMEGYVWMIDNLYHVLEIDRTNEMPEVSILEMFANALVRIFVECLDSSGHKTAYVYKRLLNAVTNPMTREPRVKIAVYQLLFRVRIDKSYHVLLSNPSDMDGLASAIGRLKSTMSEETLKSALWSFPYDGNVMDKAFDEQASYCNLIQEDAYTLEQDSGHAMLNISIWLNHVVQQINDGNEWEIYSFIISHLPPQLSNLQLFMTSRAEIQWLRATVCEQLTGRLVQYKIPKGISKADIQVVMIRTMSSIIGYQSFFSKADQDSIVKSVLVGFMSWERIGAACVHCLLVCSYEFPLSVKKFLSQIFTNLQTKITNSGLSVHILEFLTSMARIPSLTSNFTQDDFKRVFAMAFKYMEHANDLPSKSRDSNSTVLSTYLVALAHSVIATWFLTMRMADRRDLAPFITRGLLSNGKREMSSVDSISAASDERGWALIDLISRFTYSDVPLKMHNVFSGLGDAFSPEITRKERVLGKIWIHGISIVSIETATRTGITQIVNRRPTGTTSFRIFPDRDVFPELLDSITSADDPVCFMPEYYFRQLIVAPELQSALNPTLITNPSDSPIVRAISIFDRTPVVEFHKIGIIYIGPGQTTEEEIFANRVGSRAYLDFIDGMGCLIKLKGNKQIYTGGLDTENDIDGEHAYAWSDKITQAIFHCTTMMPSGGDGNEEYLWNKKRHIGNNYVNIYWNESNRPFNFEMVKSQFNFINIVISPHTKASRLFANSSRPDSIESDSFFKVRLFTKPSSSLASNLKIIGKKSLPDFVRNLALNADIFAVVWHTGPNDEYLSNWQYRLRQIRSLKDRADSGNNISESITNNARSDALVSSIEAQLNFQE